MAELTKEQRAAIEAAIAKKKAALTKEEPRSSVGFTQVESSVKKPASGKPKQSNVDYDVYAPETMKAAEDKGYGISKIDESVRYTGTSVGAQSIWDPESGFYYKEGAPKPGKEGLKHYMNLHSDIIEEYKSPKGDSGPAAWERDHLEAANKKDEKGRFGRGDKAIEHVVTNVDKRYADVTGKHLIDFSKPDAYVPGVQLFNLPGIQKKKESIPLKDQDITLPEKAADVARDPFKRNPITDVRKKAYAPWWLQDIVKTSGAAADLARVKKYEPWQDTPQVFLPNATYYDPTRELAANTEQANLASQFHQAFTGPKSGAISGVQGKALDNAANIMAKYNNLNVGLANQLSHERANILNQASQNKAGLNTQLFDKYTIANQQFDNSKNMARQNLRQSYMDAITNRAKTQALNTMYPNYYTDPSMGGFMNFNPGYGPITPNRPADEFAKIDDIIKRYPGTSFEAATKYLKGDRSDNDPNSNLDPYLKAQGYGNTVPG